MYESAFNGVSAEVMPAQIAAIRVRGLGIVQANVENRSAMFNADGSPELNSVLSTP
jgi:hypothetical protein